MLTRRELIHRSGAVVAGAMAVPSIARGAQQDPEIVGQWSGVSAWPSVAIHAHLLPISTHLFAKVLTYGNETNPTTGQKADYTRSYVVDIPTGGTPAIKYDPVENRDTNLFCCGHTFLHDGRLIAMGGHVVQNYYGSSDINIFDCHPDYRWTLQNASLTSGRWYPSIITLPNGEALVLSGTIAGSSQPNPLPQVWRADGSGLRNLTGATLAIKNYPKIFVVPDGRVVHVGPEPQTRFLNTTGTGSWQTGPKRKAAMRGYGVAVLYDDGKIMTAGGAAAGGPTATAEVIDLKASSPQWRWTNPMAFARRHANATLLPDGTVLVTGGSASVDFNNATGAVLAAELWDPLTELWATLASGATPRIYHSTALLLPDGRVLWTGGGSPPPKNGKSNNNAEIFSPPYLFRGARPQVTSVPTTAKLGGTIDIATPDKSAIGAVNLTRIGSVTHTFNMNQRFNRLTFAVTGSGVRASVPADPNRLLPGHYLLFALNRSGVPSIGRMVQVTA